MRVVKSRQGGGDVVIGSPQELARCSKGVLPPGEKTTGADGGTNEGVFFGMGRLSVPQGSAMVWDGSQVGGVWWAPGGTLTPLSSSVFGRIFIISYRFERICIHNSQHVFFFLAHI